MAGRLRMSYGSASSVKSKWSTSSFSGGMGGIVYKNLGKPGIPNRFDGPCIFNTQRGRCVNHCVYFASFRHCCEKCGGSFWSNGRVSQCIGLYSGNCPPPLPL